MTIFKEMQASNEQVLSHGLRNPVSQALKGWFVSETRSTQCIHIYLKILHGPNTPTKACFIDLSQTGEKDNPQN